jgi:hypothetical protein
MVAPYSYQPRAGYFVSRIEWIAIIACLAICSSVLRYNENMSTATRRKTSFETDTVDAALSEVVKLRQRRELLELLSTPGALELDDPDVMAGAWR